MRASFLFVAAGGSGEELGGALVAVAEDVGEDGADERA